MGRNPMWISGLWYGFDLLWAVTKSETRMKTSKSVLMRKTIVFNLLLILGYLPHSSIVGLAG